MARRIAESKESLHIHGEWFSFKVERKAIAIEHT